VDVVCAALPSFFLSFFLSFSTKCALTRVCVRACVRHGHDLRLVFLSLFLSLLRYLLYTPRHIHTSCSCFCCSCSICFGSARFISYPPFLPRLSLSATKLYPSASASLLFSSLLFRACAACVSVYVSVSVSVYASAPGALLLLLLCCGL
jgi:hypothetical protein